jgi:hypothetical protein
MAKAGITLTLEPHPITEKTKDGRHRIVQPLNEEELSMELGFRGATRRMWVKRADGEFVAATPTREGARRA